MTARPDGTALWLRGPNEVVDGKEGLPPSISPLNTSCEGPRGPFHAGCRPEHATQGSFFNLHVYSISKILFVYSGGFGLTHVHLFLESAWP